jgi:hypothetical protein
MDAFSKSFSLHGMNRTERFAAASDASTLLDSISYDSGIFPSPIGGHASILSKNPVFLDQIRQ